MLIRNMALSLLISLFAGAVLAATMSNISTGGVMNFGNSSSAPSYPAGSTHFDMTTAGNYFDIMGANARLGYLETNVYARALFSTTSTSVTVDYYTNYPYTHNEMGVVVDGAIYTNIVLPSSAGTTGTYSLTLPAGAKTVEFINGPQQYASPIKGGWMTGLTFLNDTGVTKVTPTPTSKMVIFGDSISIGFGSTHPATESWPAILRLYWTAGGIVNYGQGALSLSDICTNATNCMALATTLVSNFSGATNKYLYIQISTNDWSRSASLTTFRTNYALLMADVHALDSSVQIFAQTTMPRDGGTSPNLDGKTIADWQAGITAECNAKAAYCTVVDGNAILTYPDDFGDGVHPKSTAQQKYADYVKTVLGI